MKTETRKLITIITEAVIEEKVLRDIQKLGVAGYTLTEARGKGSRGVRNAVWENTSGNIRIEVVCDEKTAMTVAAHLQEHYYQDFAMILFMNDVQVLRPQKFTEHPR